MCVKVSVCVCFFFFYFFCWFFLCVFMCAVDFVYTIDIGFKVRLGIRMLNLYIQQSEVLFASYDCCTTTVPFDFYILTGSHFVLPYFSSIFCPVNQVPSWGSKGFLFNILFFKHRQEICHSGEMGKKKSPCG